LEKIKVRPSVRAKGHLLSIDDRVMREILQGGRDVLEPLVQDVLPSGIEGRSTSTPHDLQPIAVQLDFFCGSLETGRQSMVSMKPTGSCGRELFFGMISGGTMSHRIAAWPGDATDPRVLAHPGSGQLQLGSMSMRVLTEIHPYSICSLPNLV
jgi:hypothetical protein